MQILPAIDILDGKAVRLRQGRYEDVTVYNDDPVDQARQWVDGGAEWLHVVDLDGARTGEPKNIAIVRRIVAAVDIPVEVGGGIRSVDTLQRLMDAGVTRAVLGTTLVTQPEFVEVATELFPDAIVAGIDAKDGMVAIEGWREGSEYEALHLARELQALGVKRVAYTDISRDGMQVGPNVAAYRTLVEQLDLPIIASGGVSTRDDLRALAAIGSQVEAAIVGKALYEGAFTIAEAVAAGRGEA